MRAQAGGGGPLRRRARTALAVLLLAALGAPPWAFGEERTPEDYGEDEFPRILQDLRRGEIILAGSLPFTLFIALEAVDIYRYASRVYSDDPEENEQAPAYAPWPFRSPNSPPYEPAEATAILVTALSLSALLAIADYVVGKIIEHRAKNPPSRGR